MDTNTLLKVQAVMQRIEMLMNTCILDWGDVDGDHFDRIQAAKGEARKEIEALAGAKPINIHIQAAKGEPDKTTEELELPCQSCQHVGIPNLEDIEKENMYGPMVKATCCKCYKYIKFVSRTWMEQYHKVMSQAADD